MYLTFLKREIRRGGKIFHIFTYIYIAPALRSLFNSSLPSKKEKPSSPIFNDHHTSSSLFGGWKIHIFQSWKPSDPLQEAYLRDAVDGGDRKTLTFESWQRRRGSIQVFVEAFSRNTVVRNTKYEVGCTGEGARRSNSIKGPTEVKIDDTDFSLPPLFPCASMAALSIIGQFVRRLPLESSI